MHQRLSDLAREEARPLLLAVVLQLGKLSQHRAHQRQWKHFLVSSFNHVYDALEAINFAKSVRQRHCEPIFVRFVLSSEVAGSDVLLAERSEVIVRSGVLPPDFAKQLDQFVTTLGDG